MNGNCMSVGMQCGDYLDEGMITIDEGFDVRRRGRRHYSFSYD